MKISRFERVSERHARVTPPSASIDRLRAIGAVYTGSLPSCDVTDPELLPQHGRVVLVVLQDGRQIEGELHTMTGHFEVGGVVFQSWEVETLEDLA